MCIRDSRLINTGEKPMKIGACWPCDAGHDYAAVERQPFGYRVYKEEGTLRFEKVEDVYKRQVYSSIIRYRIRSC